MVALPLFVRVTVCGALLAPTGGLDRTRAFARGLRKATRTPGGLLRVGTPAEEPWHLHLSVTEYLNETIKGVALLDFGVGIFKSSVFGVLVAISGCMRGIKSGRSASAVGLAATSAVVTAIVLIIVTDGIFAVLTNVLGI